MELKQQSHQYPPQTLATVGRYIMIVSWVGGLIAANTLLGFWKLVVAETSPFYRWCQWFDSMVMAIFGCYVVTWWWSVISWCGNELFKHSQGLKGKHNN